LIALIEASRREDAEMDQKGSHDYFLPSLSLLAKVETLDSVRQKIIYSRRLERLWLFIEESYSDPDIRLRDAAKCSGVSQDHLNILLSRFANTTFHDLLARYRIEKCLELLNTRNYTLTEIYSRCGFNSPTTFDRQFKRWVGCLPSQYKLAMTNKRS
jgi:AraC-like DNA-binding protein